MISPALISRCTALFEKAEKVYKHEGIEDRLSRLSQLYHYGRAGEAEAAVALAVGNEQGIHVNKVYPRVRSAMASMFAKRPQIFARGRRASDTVAATTAEVLLNYLCRVLKYPRELREWLFWARLGMYGVLKLGMEEWRGFTLPMIRARDPRSVRVDVTPDRWRPDEGQWQAFKHKKSVAQLRASKLYEEKDVDRLAEVVGNKKSDFNEETTDVWIWENYLRNTGREILIGTCAHGYDAVGLTQDERVWIREDQFTDVIGFPGRFLTFAPSPKTWYPISPVELWLDQQKEVNVFRQMKLMAAESSNPKTLYDMGAFSEEEIQKLEIPQRGYVGVNAGKLREAMMAEPNVPVSQDVYAGEIDADNSITEIDGIGTAQLGVEAPKRGSTSATRDAIVENNLRLRSSDNQEYWDEALEDVFQGVLNLAQAHMKGELYLRIVGQAEVRMSSEDIRGDIDVQLSFGSTLPVDQDREFDQALELFRLFANRPGINQDKLNRYLLQKKGDIKDVESWIAPPPAPPPPAPGPMAGAPPPMEGPPPGNGGGGDLASMLNEMAQRSSQAGASPLSFASQLRGVA